MKKAGVAASLPICFLFFIFSNLRAQSYSTLQWTPEQMIVLDVVSAPVISPEGKYVAYEYGKHLWKMKIQNF